MHITYDVHDFGLVGFFAALVDDGKIQAKLHGKIACPGDRADIGRNDYIIIGRLADQVTIVLDKDVSAGKVIDRNVKEALNLCGVKIHGEDSVRTGCRNEVCNELCRDGIAASGFAILTGIAEIRNNSRDTACRCTAAGVNHDEKLHHVVIDVVAGGLDDENVTATDGFLKGDGTFPVSKLGDGGAAEIHEKIAANIFCEAGIGVTGEDFELLRVRCHCFFFLRHEIKSLYYSTNV